VTAITSHGLNSVLVLAASVALAQPTLTPQSVLNSAASLGARPTLERLYNDQRQWSALLAGIATGTPAWLEVATTLHVVSDAGSSEQLGSAVGEALEHRPANVLALAIPNFLLEVVCGPPDVDDPRFDSYELSMAAIERRETKLRAMHKRSLAALRDACMSELEKAKGDMARFYEHAT
jgi:hypothetical protein